MGNIWVMLRKNAMYFYNLILIQPDTRGLQLRLMDETFVCILGIDIYHKISKVFPCSRNKGWLILPIGKTVLN
jgi:hypothetical protein